VLVTAHRRESFGAPLRAICLAVRDLAAAFADDGLQFVYPVHLNPNVRRPVREVLAGLDNVSLVEPLDYPALVHLMRRSVLVLTDSGGIQEEAPGLGVPVLVMRETTERPEGVEAGVVRLVGTDRGRIVGEASRLLRDPSARAAMATGANLYGDGRAAVRIVAHLLSDAPPWMNREDFTAEGAEGAEKRERDEMQTERLDGLNRNDRMRIQSTLLHPGVPVDPVHSSLSSSLRPPRPPR
jgi:UDP-N-acetylglucosamine 2-epimerase